MYTLYGLQLWYGTTSNETNKQTYSHLSNQGTKSDVDCTYDQPSNRRRNPLPQYTEALENRLQRAEALLRTLLPNVDINDPNIETVILQRGQAGNVTTGPIANQAASGETPAPNPQALEQDSQLRSMIESTGQLDLDERGYWDFHGGSSGTVFVRRMREQFGNLLGGGPVLPRIPRPAQMATMFDSPRSSANSPFEAGLPNTMDLPSREAASELAATAFSCGCSLLRFVHRPSFYEMFDRIYDVPVENFGDEENRFLPLLYVTLALGCMFHTDPADDPDQPTEASYKSSIDRG